MAGKKNMVFGFLYLLFTLGLGLYLTSNFADTSFGSHERSLLTDALFKSNLDAALNIIAGFLICRLPLVDWVSRLVSALMIAGALLHSGVVYLGAFGLLTFAMNLTIVGSFLIVAVMLFMGIGVLGLRIVK